MFCACLSDIHAVRHDGSRGDDELIASIIRGEEDRRRGGQMQGCEGNMVGHILASPIYWIIVFLQE